MSAYGKFLAATLPGIIGITLNDGCKISNGNHGYLCYGPFIKLAPGKYCAGFRVKALQPLQPENGITLDVSRRGDQIFARRNVPGDELLLGLAGFIALNFEIDEHVEDIEIRLLLAPGADIMVKDLVVFRSDML